MKKTIPEFRRWLDEQKSPVTSGAMTVPEFVAEAAKRGVNLRQSTVYKWTKRSKTQRPRVTKREDLIVAFPGIKF